MLSQVWQLLQANKEEVAHLGSLAKTLQWPSEPAAPANTWRHVQRIQLPQGTYYLKTFLRSQWKNQWRNRTSKPHCRLDGEREMLVALALQDRGIGTARPIAVGRQGPCSYYLCAELEGQSLAEVWSKGQGSRQLAYAAARYAGQIIRQGVLLPDLSADHIYCQPSMPEPQFAVLDLHNGRLAQRMSSRQAFRILRRFRKSTRHLALSRLLVMGFALRFLKAAGLGQHSRKILQRLGPMDTHGRYELDFRTKAYRQRNPKRGQQELRLLHRIWPGQAGDLVLDMPTGTGRLASTLQDDFAVRLVGADRAMAMLRQAQQREPSLPLLQADVMALPFADASVDGMVMFRFLHHLPAAQAKQAIQEAARVSKSYLVISFFHPVSLHHLQRKIRRRISGKAQTRFAHGPGQIKAWLAEQGFVAEQLLGQRPYLQDFWLASFRRRHDNED